MPVPSFAISFGDTHTPLLLNKTRRSRTLKSPLVADVFSSCYNAPRSQRGILIFIFIWVIWWRRKLVAPWQRIAMQRFSPLQDKISAEDQGRRERIRDTGIQRGEEGSVLKSRTGGLDMFLNREPFLKAAGGRSATVSFSLFYSSPPPITPSLSATSIYCVILNSLSIYSPLSGRATKKRKTRTETSSLDDVLHSLSTWKISAASGLCWPLFFSQWLKSARVFSFLDEYHSIAKVREDFYLPSIAYLEPED